MHQYLQTTYLDKRYEGDFMIRVSFIVDKHFKIIFIFIESKKSCIKFFKRKKNTNLSQTVITFE